MDAEARIPIMPEQKSPKSKILVVDDEPLVCEAVEMILSFDGHEVVTANSGKAALALFGQNRFDVVTVDYKMPEMTGAELAQAIKARVPDQPIIMITAHAEVLKTSGESLTGVDCLINKPFQLKELRDAIQKVSRR
jgi:two-component system, cell cycle sensor histidine kinase and response regulator CckA